MNASTFSTAADLLEDNNTGSDSDTNTDAAPPPAAEYYQPISSLDDSDDDDSSLTNSDEDHHHSLYSRDGVENGVSSLHLNGDVEENTSSGEEEDGAREAHNSAISRALREDESRRSAPLSAEEAMRVMEAMRGISFGGSAPDWAGRVPEDQWINQLRSLRQTQPSNFS